MYLPLTLTFPRMPSPAIKLVLGEPLSSFSLPFQITYAVAVIKLEAQQICIPRGYLHRKNVCFVGAQLTKTSALLIANMQISQKKPCVKPNQQTLLVLWSDQWSVFSFINSTCARGDARNVDYQLAFELLFTTVYSSALVPELALG